MQAVKYYSSSIGTEIIESKTGKLLAKVSDLIINTETGVIKSILTNFDEVLHLSDIKKWGRCIHIQSDILFRDIENSKETLKILEKEISVIGNKVIDTNGNFLGYCEDFSFHENTGAVLTLFSKKSFLGFFQVQRFAIGINSVVEITPKNILVQGMEMKDTATEI